eukprot:1179317-Prorocentrum_minimum.AAC.5
MRGGVEFLRNGGGFTNAVSCSGGGEGGRVFTDTNVISTDVKAICKRESVRFLRAVNLWRLSSPSPPAGIRGVGEAGVAERHCLGGASPFDSRGLRPCRRQNSDTNTLATFCYLAVMGLHTNQTTRTAAKESRHAVEVPFGSLRTPFVSKSTY